MDVLTNSFNSNSSFLVYRVVTLITVTGLVCLQLLFIDVADSITNGYRVNGDKRYVVYLLKSPRSAKKYRDWTCGGAIIHPYYILTSAACLYDVGQALVVNGYRIYVNARDINSDRCINRTARRIVSTCTPKKFFPDYLFNKLDYWNLADIAVARVDRVFEFHDMSYYRYCSYPPAPIRVNTMSRSVQQGRDVVAFGWGHTKYMRPAGVNIDLNEKYLRYSAGKTSLPADCYKNYYNDPYKNYKGIVYNPDAQPAMCVKGFTKTKVHSQNSTLAYILGYKQAIKQFLICVDKPSIVDEDGRLPSDEKLDKFLLDNCTKASPKSQLSQPEGSVKCRNALRSNDPNLTSIGGICQNDHGGPLVTWVGGHETLIGVATMCFVTNKMECRGPFLYTSTHCVGKLIWCAIHPNRFRRNVNCDESLSDMGYELRNITWPDGLPNDDVPETKNNYENFDYFSLENETQSTQNEKISKEINDSNSYESYFDF